MFNVQFSRVDSNLHFNPSHFPHILAKQEDKAPLERLCGSITLSDIQNRELRNSNTDLPVEDILGTKKLCIQWSMHLYTGEYAFGTTLHVEQKQVDRSPPSKQN